MSEKRTIWKFTLDSPDPVIELPAGAQVVEFASQHGHLCMWAVVDPAAPRVKRRFHIVGTGHEFEAWWSYLSTARMASGLVWHLLAEWSPR